MRILTDFTGVHQQVPLPCYLLALTWHPDKEFRSGPSSFFPRNLSALLSAGGHGAPMDFIKNRAQLNSLSDRIEFVIPMKSVSRRTLRFPLILGGLLVAGGVMASYDGIVGSIHFYGPGWYGDGKTPVPDFGRVPSRVMQPGWNNEIQRAGTQYGRRPTSWTAQERQENEVAWHYLHARNLEAQGVYRGSLREYLQSSASDAFKRDRSELLGEVRFQKVAGLAEYLRDTYLLQTGNEGQTAAAVKDLLSLRPDPRVEAHREYALVWASSTKGRRELAHQYFEVYQRFPYSPRAESALVMSARSLLEDRQDSGIASGDILEARTDLHLLLRRFPNSRFRRDASGWLIRCDWLEGKEAQALAEYRLRAESGPTSAVRWMGYESIAQICRINRQWSKEIKFLLLQRLVSDTSEHQLWTGRELRKRFDMIGVADARTVQREIRHDARLLESYVAFRIEDTSLNARQEKSLLAFAESSLENMPHPTEGLLERVAQIGYNNGRYRTARRLALRALSFHVPVADKARARYVLAASLGRMGRTQDAIREYKLLLNEKGPHFLLHGALEHLALLQERSGDRLAALRSFYRLGYDLDVAYLVDAEMTPRELERYIASYATADQRPVLTYSLGMRYLRSENYGLAVSTFESLSRSRRLHFGLSKADYASTLDGVTAFDSLPSVRDPLVSARKLWHFRKVAFAARTHVTKAKALYAMASYIYHQGGLLYYSGGLWRGERAMSISDFWNPQVNNRAETRTLDTYCHEHEALAHVMGLCKSIENMGLHNSVVAQAYYTDGLASSRLSNFNEWWRNKQGLDAHAVNSMSRLVRLYPHHSLAKAARKYKQVFAEESQTRYPR